MTGKSIGARIIVGALGVALVASGCGSSATDAGSTKDGSASSSDRTDSVQAVYAAVSGLTGTQRYDKLLELAKQEGGSVSFYHSGVMTAENEAFTKQTGIKVADFQATSERVAERVLQEKKAGRVGSDVVIGAASDMQNLQEAGGIATLDSPAAATVSAQFKSKDLISAIVIMETPAYNKASVKSSELPESWTDFFQSFHKRKAIELTDWSWLYTVVTHYFEAKKGMTEQEAIDLITDGMKGISAVDGHSVVSSLLASGQYDAVPNVFSEEYEPLVRKGAPISYLNINPDLPPVAVLEDIGLTAASKHPASGLLYLEWLMSTEGQQAVASTFYVPTASTYKGPQTLLQKYPYAMVDDSYRLSATEQDQWKSKFDQLLRAAGANKIEKK